MDELRYFRRLFAYDAWANGGVLEAVDGVPSVPEGVAGLLGHLAAFHWLWLARIRKMPPRLELWPTLTPEECRRHLKEAADTWDTVLRSRSPDALRDLIRYTNTKGEAWQDTLRDVLQHVVMHSAYHRGQIALLLRQAGVVPASTDYIQAIRTGAIR